MDYTKRVFTTLFLAKLNEKRQIFRRNFPKIVATGCDHGDRFVPWPIKRLLSAPWKFLAIVRNFRTAARNFRRLARNFRRLARNLHAVAGAVLLRLFHHVVAQLLEWFSASCSYIIVVICPFLLSPLAPATPRLGVGGVRGAGCFSVSLLLRAHSVASTTCAVLASGGVRRHMGPAPVV